MRPDRPYLLPTAAEQALDSLRVSRTKNPYPDTTLGDLGVAVRVGGEEKFEPVVLVLPVARSTGIAPASVRVFRAETRSRRLLPVWSSGFNPELGFAWARIRRPGLYVAIGLPRDRLVQEILRGAAEEELLDDLDGDDTVELRRRAFAPFLETDAAELAELRGLLATLELKTGVDAIPMEEIEFREGGHLAGFKLPGGATLEEFRERLARVLEAGGELAEEALLDPPEFPRDGWPPWPPAPNPRPWEELIDPRLVQHLIPKKFFQFFPRLCWLLSRDWWMYHADERHTGAAHGCSDINSSTASGLVLQSDVAVDGTVVTIPSIVGGKVYVGTGGYGANAGTLYKIDLGTGSIEGRFPTAGNAFYPYDGIGGSPAVVGGRVYFTAVHGKVYCVNAATMTATPPHPPPLWVVDLKNADPAHNQPVRNPSADSWTSPLVVNNRVYVACGEGEAPTTYSFIYCLDATTGNVLWLFCTNQFQAGADNSPNVIPQSAVGISPLPAMFTSRPDPPHPGAAPWSSPAYSATVNRIYIGTGNSVPDNPLPDEKYASGIISLDATTGAFGAFFQPAPGDSYRPGDLDVDVPAAPTIFNRGGSEVVCIGSKNGSFFLLDPATLQVLGGGAQRRQLLPRHAATGAALPTVDPTGGVGENRWGVMATAAVHRRSGKLFVGLGGYMGIDDYRVTPFVRALDWNTLADAWPTTVATIDGNPVSRYSAAQPPLYTTPGEAGLSSPAVVNDVVFVSTSKTALYALRVDNGLCLWNAPGMPSGGWPDFCLGPAIYGNYVVVGAARKVLIYHLPRRYWPWHQVVFEPWWARYIEVFPPFPPPPPPPDILPPFEEPGEPADG